jgi:hypothetical protein
MRLRTNEPRQARKGAAEVAFVCAVGCLAFFCARIWRIFLLSGFRRLNKLRFRLRVLLLVAISR